MTSKEALNDLIDEIKHTHNNGKTLTNYDQKRTDIIEKDLEVLEILKRTKFHIYKLGFPDNYMLHLDTDHSIQITEEEANLIRKVLEIITD